MFPDKPITKKPIEVRMGNGKGSVEFHVAVVQPGRMLYEMEGDRREDRARGIPPGRGEAVGADLVRYPDGDVMNATELKKKTPAEISEHIVELRKEQFGLRMQKGTGQLTQTHQLKRVRRDIARAKTALGKGK